MKTPIGLGQKGAVGTAISPRDEEGWQVTPRVVIDQMDMTQ